MSLPPDTPSKEEDARFQDSNQTAEKPQNKIEQAQQDSHPTQPANDEPYSVHGTGAKRLIVLAASVAGFFSPLSASIYYPALPAIEKALNVSGTKVNLTVTTYLILQGLAPMVTASFSDSAGRRPGYAVCFIVYVFANLGLGLQNSYAALMVLRALQSAGSSGAIAIANGVVSDIITPQERGSYIAFASVGSILGPSLSPIIGGLFAQYTDWHWIFWFLLIFSGAFCVPFFLFFPETCRKIVGNGRGLPPFWNRNLLDIMRARKEKHQHQHLEHEEGPANRQRPRLSIPNPLGVFVVFTNLQTVMTLCPAGVAFGSYYAVLTGASSEFTRVYHFSEIKVALIFLPIGVGGLVSALSTGKLVNWNFSRHARKLGITVARNRRQELLNFPIERARLEIALPVFCLGCACTVVYGWLMTRHVNVSGPIILLFVMSWSFAAFYQVLNVLLVDTYPGRGAMVTAVVNLVRCELGAGMAALIGPLTNATGSGWSYTIIALIGLAATSPLLITMKYGMKWRQESAAKAEEKKKRSLEARQSQQA
ncbi:putative MFS multidrug transporter [Xylogone sp. PMI_703]|nr:putative MFS multidrug transporter [Xylogone sp. PMI_703]